MDHADLDSRLPDPAIEEALRNLAQIPVQWRKIVAGSDKNRGYGALYGLQGGENSKIDPLGSPTGPKERAELIKQNASKYSVFYLTTTDGVPVAMMKRHMDEPGGSRYTKPWDVVTDEGKTKGVQDYRKTRSFNRYSPPSSRAFTRTELNLEEATSGIDFTAGVQLYGVTSDPNRAQLQQQRKEIKAGKGGSMQDVRSSAGEKFIGKMAGGIADTLRQEIDKLTNEIKSAIDTEVDKAFKGEGGSIKSDQMSSTIGKLNELLYGARQIGEKLKKLRDGKRGEGLRNEPQDQTVTVEGPGGKSRYERGAPEKRRTPAELDALETDPGRRQRDRERRYWTYDYGYLKRDLEDLKKKLAAVKPS